MIQTILISILLFFMIYLVTRVLTFGIFKSYFQAKKQSTIKKEIKDGETE